MSKRPLNLGILIGDEPIQTPAAPAPAPEVKRPVGRPKAAPRPEAKRIAVTLDGDTYRRVAHACIDLGLDRQQFLEQAVELMLKRTDGE